MNIELRDKRNELIDRLTSWSTEARRQETELFGVLSYDFIYCRTDAAKIEQIRKSMPIARELAEHLHEGAAMLEEFLEGAEQ